ncbi:MAG: cytochrome c biogenesis protein ResB [Nitrospiraceae bacterium]|nr:MAG: cytochrome c biogenesis protein ResB [Nitrospiraceae bacterium]
MEEKEKQDVFETIWKFLASVKLAVAVFIILALSSIIGTIVEQQAEPARNIALLAKFFGDSAAPTVYNIFAKLGFMDMYRSWWFVSLLSLFSINLIVCSIDRFPRTWKLVKMPLKPLAENVIRTLPVKKETKFRTTVSAAKGEFLNSLRSSGYRALEATEKNGVQLYCQKWQYSRLGVYVVHLSIILIFIGAIVGARFGFGGFLNLPEGQESEFVYSQDGTPMPLGFSIKCNWYETSYYAGMDTPQEFQSELVILENGKEVLKKVIEVNSPLTYKGITFFQSSYGMVPNANGYFVFTVTPNGGRPETLWLRFGDTFEIPGTGISGTIADFSPALARNQVTGALITYSENMVNPAAGVRFSMPGQGAFKGWILKRHPETGVLPGGHTIKFDDYWGVEYTGLQVSKDPGVWLIYIACIIMSIGLYVAFFISHKKIWVHIAHEGPGDKGPVRISVGGNTSRNTLAFEKEIESIISRASHAIEEKHSGK